MKRFLKLHHLILAGMVAGALFGLAFQGASRGRFAYDLADTVGAIFLNLLKAVMVPMVVASLIVGMLAVGDPRKLGRIGVKAMLYFLVTTLAAITIGLVCVNVVRPDRSVTRETRDRLQSEYQGDVASRKEHFRAAQAFTGWDFARSLVTGNPFRAMADEPPQMLPIIVFTMLVGLAAALLPPATREPFERFVGSLNEVMLKLVQVVMVTAPLGAAALIAKVVMTTGIGIFATLLAYTATVLLAYAIHFFTVYSLAVRICGRMSPLRFWNGMREAFLTAFSTSSSAATLPVNLKCARERLGVSAPVANFVLPLGATVNMDGTSIMQAVASVFIGFVYLGELPLGAQASILVTATLASIGTAPVPAAGIVMLAAIMTPLGVPLEGIALILGVDRLLDMCRTVLNITGDAAGAVAIAASEGELKT